MLSESRDKKKVFVFFFLSLKKNHQKLTARKIRLQIFRFACSSHFRSNELTFDFTFWQTNERMREHIHFVFVGYSSLDEFSIPIFSVCLSASIFRKSGKLESDLDAVVVSIDSLFPISILFNN